MGSEDGLRQIAYDNVLSTEETCRTLNRSRQQLNNYVKDGKLKVLKSMGKSNLFWKPDVYEFIRELNRERPREKHTIYGTSSEDAIRAFHSLNINKDEVQEVYIFFDQRDAAQYNFYNVIDVEMPNTPTRIDAARFVIIMKDGEEFWLNSLTCGYSGIGCGASETVLYELGIEETDKGYNPRVERYRICHYYREDDMWSFEGHESPMDEALDSVWKNKDEHILGVESSLFRYNGKLVLTQGARYRKSFFGEKDVEEPSLRLLATSLYYVPNAVSVEFLRKEEAMATGHYEVVLSDTLIYQIIIRDASDRELWLTYPFEDIPVKKRYNVVQLMQMLGVDTEGKAEKSSFIANWFNKDLITYYGVHEVKGE